MKRYNEEGIIKPDAVLRSIKESYDSNSKAPLCPNLRPCKEINFTLELFFGLNETPADILSAISESARYLREIIPSDGITVDKLV